MSLFHRRPLAPALPPPIYTQTLMNGDDPRLAVLGQCTPEGHLTPGYGNSYLFFAGRDDLHGIIKHLITAETMYLKGTMYGFADDDLNEAIMDLVKNPNVHVQMSLDKSQAAGSHERKILELDETTDPDFYNSFCIVESATHQIAHSKSMIFVGQGVAFDGSTNLSNSGEGTGISLKPNVKPMPGYKAQENTLHVFTSHVDISRLSARLDTEHMVGLTQHYQVK